MGNEAASAPGPYPSKKDIEAAILARLTDKPEHTYQWPRWAAADEAAQAVVELLSSLEEARQTQSTMTVTER
jgi:hypothetical protein